MSSVVRFYDIRTQGAKNLAQIQGAECQRLVVKKTFAAGEIGNGIGQTQHAQGCPVATGLPAPILSYSFSVFRAGRCILNFSDGTSAHITSMFLAINTGNKGFVFRDAGNDDGIRVVAGDVLEVTLVVGNQSSFV